MVDAYKRVASKGSAPGQYWPSDQADAGSYTMLARSVGHGSSSIVVLCGFANTLRTSGAQKTACAAMARILHIRDDGVGGVQRASSLVTNASGRGEHRQDGS